MAEEAQKLADEQPESFAFTPENEAKAKEIIARYPDGKQGSAVMPLFDLAQRQNDGWLPEPAIRYVADMLDISYIRALEVATFYSMYNLSPVGKYYVAVCTTTPCWLCGAEGIMAACKERLGVDVGETTEDMMFTLDQVECMGACVNGPMIQINDDYYEDLTKESVVAILDKLAAGETPTPGPQIERQKSAPVGGRTTLKSKEAGDARG